MKNRMMTKDSNLRTRSDKESDKKYLEGYFIRFNETTELYDGIFETIAPEAVERSKDEDVVCLFNHDDAVVLGRTSTGTLELSVDDEGLYGVVEINEDDQEALDIFARVKRGDIHSCSFGFSPLAEERIERDDGGVEFVVKDAVIKEVSIVTFPAYDTSYIKARRSQADEYVENKKEERLLRMKKELLERVGRK